MQQFFHQYAHRYQHQNHRQQKQDIKTQQGAAKQGGHTSGGHQQPAPQEKAASGGFFAENQFFVHLGRAHVLKQGFVQGFVLQQGIPHFCAEARRVGQLSVCDAGGGQGAEVLFVARQQPCGGGDEAGGAVACVDFDDVADEFRAVLCQKRLHFFLCAQPHIAAADKRYHGFAVEQAAGFFPLQEGGNRLRGREKPDGIGDNHDVVIVGGNGGRQNRRRFQVDGFGKGVEKPPKRPRKRIRLLRFKVHAIHMDTALLQRFGEIPHQFRQLSGLRVIHQQHFFHVVSLYVLTKII